MRRLIVCLGFLAACTGDSAGPTAVRSPGPVAFNLSDYTTVRMGFLPGWALSTAAAVNNLGQAVGRGSDIYTCCGAFLWQAGVMTDLGGLGTPISSDARDINDAGQVVGWSVNQSGVRRAFLWQNGTMIDLGELVPNGSSEAYAINEQGMIVGAAQSSWGNHAFRWTAATGMVDLGTLPGHFSYASDVNERGEVVGNLHWSGGNAPSGGLYWDAAGNMTSPAAPNGLGTSGFHAINDSGVAVGFGAVPFSPQHAFSWSLANGWRDLAIAAGSQGYYSDATDISNSGLIVGGSTGSRGGGACAINGNPCAAVWLPSDSLVMLVNLQLTPGRPALGSSAGGVNDIGQIVGAGYYSTPTSGSWSEATMWPAPVPSAGTPQASTNGPWSSLEGSPVVFDASSSTDPDADPLTYTWYFGDGTPTSTGVQVSHAYANDRGPYQVLLTVRDPAGHSNTVAGTATVANVIPTVTVVPPMGPVQYGVAVGWTSTATDPGVDDGHLWVYEWGDGAKQDSIGLPAPGPAVIPHTYANPGDYVLVVRVSDVDGGVGADTVPVHVVGGNRAPVAGILPWHVGVEGGTVEFDASTSSDLDGDPLTYRWDFGDGGIATGVKPTHVYLRDANFVVSVIATDAGGLSDTASSPAYIVNMPPYADAGSDLSVPAGASFAPYLAITDAGTQDSPWAVSVDWGDGSQWTGTAMSVGPLAATHVYSTVGTYTLVVAVTDPDGASDTDGAIITVTPAQAPIALPNGPYTGNEGTAVGFSAAGSSDPNSDPLTYFWKFGDGGTSPSAAPVHTYADNGIYTVILMVFDPAGHADTATTTATIANVPPNGTFKRPTTAVNEGSGFTLSVSGATDPSAPDRSGGFQYAFDCGAGYGAFGASASKSCPKAADNPSLMTGAQIKDKDGGVRQYTGPVTVKNIAPTVTITAGGAVTIPAGTTFRLDGKFNDPGALDSPWTYTATWGDGTATSTGVAMSGVSFPVQHRFTKRGTWALRMTVRDKDGGQGASNTIMVTVQ